jgi:hypothetical protein
MFRYSSHTVTRSAFVKVLEAARFKHCSQRESDTFGLPVAIDFRIVKQFALLTSVMRVFCWGVS